MDSIEAGKTYKFHELEDYLYHSDRANQTLIVANAVTNEQAIMHVFFGNFSKDWQAGDAVLFYNNGETHSANRNEHFILVSIIGF